MNAIVRFVRLQAARIVALLVVLSVYGFARLPEISPADRAGLASRFSFKSVPLPELHDRNKRYVRPVHPDFERISSWISAVGAAVALNDLDGDGLSNDLCYVDTRTDQVIVARALDGGYRPFELDAAPLHYDAATMAPMGCLPGDFNEDGLMDILVYYWGRTPIIFLRNGPAPAGSALARNMFSPFELTSNQERWYTNCATQADVDGDGHVDLIIGNFFPDGSRLLDVNGDQRERTIREQMQDGLSRAYNGGGQRLFLWSGTAAGNVATALFIEVPGAFSDDSGKPWALAVGAADLDGDLLPEIYFANDFGPDRLLHNRSTPGNPRFVPLAGIKHLTTPNSKVLGRDSFKGMGVDFGDLNGDGYLDIYVSNIAEEYALEESHFVWVSTGKVELMKKGIAPYEDRSESLGLSRGGWGWDTRLEDFDNDGVSEALLATGFMKGSVNRWPEMHEIAMGNDQLMSHPGWWPRFQPGDDLSGQDHDRFFVRAASGRYYDLAEELGLGQSQITRGIAVADVNGDGRLDFALANQWMPSYLYLNESPVSAGFLGLHLMLPARPGSFAETRVVPGHASGIVRGRPAIGASASVRVGGERHVAE
ncbi:MAG TPA: VCBS repeat-containing protein, partial [Blastocatellia bacterium]|nr:VCBS repeat-containing protein [Blastocatellia bacterium]